MRLISSKTDPLAGTVYRTVPGQVGTGAKPYHQVTLKKDSPNVTKSSNFEPEIGEGKSHSPLDFPDSKPPENRSFRRSINPFANTKTDEKPKSELKDNLKPSDTEEDRTLRFKDSPSLSGGNSSDSKKSTPPFADAPGEQKTAFGAKSTNPFDADDDDDEEEEDNEIVNPFYAHGKES